MNLIANSHTRTPESRLTKLTRHCFTQDRILGRYGLRASQPYMHRHEKMIRLSLLPIAISPGKPQHQGKRDKSSERRKGSLVHTHEFRSRVCELVNLLFAFRIHDRIFCALSMGDPSMYAYAEYAYTPGLIDSHDSQRV